MRISEFFKNKDIHKRSAILLISFVLYGYIITNIFAYYSSSDTVTNKFSGKSIGLDLYEPEWDAEGSYMAQKSEPGMVIPKDPYAKNTGEMDEVVRIRLEIYLDESKVSLPSGNSNNDNMIVKASDTERKIAILKSILYSDNSSFMNINIGSSDGIGNKITVSGKDGKSYIVDYKSTQFLIKDISTRSNDFVFYFYYIGGNPIGGTDGYKFDSSGAALTREHTILKTLKPGESTPKLFNKIVYPIYKKDYISVFDQGYDIKVMAEGILVKDFGDKAVNIEEFEKIANAK